jgi:hypothetical protein
MPGYRETWSDKPVALQPCLQCQRKPTQGHDAPSADFCSNCGRTHAMPRALISKIFRCLTSGPSSESFNGYGGKGRQRNLREKMEDRISNRLLSWFLLFPQNSLSPELQSLMASMTAQSPVLQARSSSYDDHPATQPLYAENSQLSGSTKTWSPRVQVCAEILRRIELGNMKSALKVAIRSFNISCPEAAAGRKRLLTSLQRYRQFDSKQVEDCEEMLDFIWRHDLGFEMWTLLRPLMPCKEQRRFEEPDNLLRILSACIPEAVISESVADHIALFTASLTRYIPSHPVQKRIWSLFTRGLVLKIFDCYNLAFATLIDRESPSEPGTIEPPAVRFKVNDVPQKEHYLPSRLLNSTNTCNNHSNSSERIVWASCVGTYQSRQLPPYSRTLPSPTSPGVSKSLHPIESPHSTKSLYSTKSPLSKQSFQLTRNMNRRHPRDISPWVSFTKPEYFIHLDNR